MESDELSISDNMGITVEGIGAESHCITSSIWISWQITHPFGEIFSTCSPRPAMLITSPQHCCTIRIGFSLFFLQSSSLMVEVNVQLFLPG